MELPHDHPEVLTPPEHPPTCCTQQTITVPPAVNAKTAQKHDYPGADWRRSYARRSGAERTNATIKDPATNNVRRGWCRLMGLSAITICLTCTLVTRNNRIIDAYETRQADNARRADLGQPPATRHRRRKTLAQLTNTPPQPLPAPAGAPNQPAPAGTRKPHNNQGKTTPPSPGALTVTPICEDKHSLP
jgi:hypothetical protein